MTPTAATWTLSDKYGNIINSRDGVTISSLSTSVTVVLSGDDLAYQSATDTGERKFLVEGTYTSSLGAGLPFRREVTFFIVDAVNV